MFILDWNNQWNQNQYGGSNSSTDNSGDTNQQWMAYYQVRILISPFFQISNNFQLNSNRRIQIGLAAMEITEAHFRQTATTTTARRSNNNVTLVKSRICS